jgi:hypothetical protein
MNRKISLQPFSEEDSKPVDGNQTCYDQQKIHNGSKIRRPFHTTINIATSPPIKGEIDPTGLLKKVPTRLETAGAVLGNFLNFKDSTSFA